MTSKPFLNALSATTYIGLVASLLYYGPMFTGEVDTIIVPIAMLSLFVLSAAIMGYIFYLVPIMQYIAGERDAAVQLFLKTIGYFASITFILFFVLFFLSN